MAQRGQDADSHGRATLVRRKYDLLRRRTLSPRRRPKILSASTFGKVVCMLERFPREIDFGSALDDTRGMFHGGQSPRAAALSWAGVWQLSREFESMPQALCGANSQVVRF